MEMRTALLSSGSKAMREKIYAWDDVIEVRTKKGTTRELPAYLSALSTCNPEAKAHSSFVTKI
jgi:hypothetical protein